MPGAGDAPIHDFPLAQRSILVFADIMETPDFAIFTSHQQHFGAANLQFFDQIGADVG